MLVSLRTLAIRNFKSFAVETVTFPSREGFYFLSGNNTVEPRLGANGAGKSSLFDALVWCLYGVTAKGSKTSDVLSWGAKKVSVATTFAIDGVEVTLTREGPPARMFVGAEPAEQKDFDRVVGLTRARFLQAVIFGQDCRLFIDLPVPERAALLDEVLDLRVWQDLSDVAAGRVRSLAHDLEQLRRDESRLQGRLSAFDLLSLERAQHEWEAQFEATINDGLLELELLEQKEAIAADDKAKAQRELEPYLQDDKPKLIDYSTATLGVELRQLSDQIAEYTSAVGAARARWADAKRDRDFFGKHTDCPTCRQPITSKLAAEMCDTAEHKQAALEKEAADAKAAIERLEARRADIERERNKTRCEYEKARERWWSVCSAADAAHAAVEALEQRIKKQIDNKPVNPFLEKIAEAERQIAATQAEFDATRKQALAVEGKKNAVEFWVQGFKRVRLFLINRVLATLELEVNSAANALGLPGGKIGFKTETETRSGTIKFGVRIEVSSPAASGAWEVWSGGEGQRIKLAVAIGLANMIQRLAGVRFDFEVWDEPTAWLSSEGIEDLVECLRYRADATKKAVWLLDHRALSFSSFTEIWEVRKTNAGSTVKQVAIDN